MLTSANSLVQGKLRVNAALLIGTQHTLLEKNFHYFRRKPVGFGKD